VPSLGNEYWTYMPKIHIDTDLGGDIDDLCALSMVLKWPDVQLLGVTTVADHDGKRAGYARYTLNIAGREEISVAAGTDVSLGCYRSWPGLPDEDIYWPEPVPPAPGPVDDALSLLERSIGQDAIVAAIGPFTNLALLEKRRPGILRNARLYLMGGYVFPPRKGFPVWSHEQDYNVQVDLQSAQYVFQHSSPTLVPIAVTVETALRRAYLDDVRRSGPLGQLIETQAEAFARDEHMEARYGETCDGVPADIINFQHDAVTCAIALGWNDGVEIQEFRVQSQIKNGWLRQWIEDFGRPTKIVTQVNGRRFNQFWLDTITRQPAYRPAAAAVPRLTSS
jgi:purine nucleosidase